MCLPISGPLLEKGFSTFSIFFTYTLKYRFLLLLKYGKGNKSGNNFREKVICYNSQEEGAHNAILYRATQRSARVGQEAKSSRKTQVKPLLLFLLKTMDEAG
jgi:hypothetical protein